MSEPTGRVEQVFYDCDGVRVTSARFQVGAQTYAMSAVNSVAFQVREAEKGGPVGLAILGGLMLAIVVSLGVATDFTAMKGFFAFSGLVMLVAGILTARSAKPTYIVSLTTASGQVQALSSEDRDYVEAVVRALNDAVVSRG